MERKHWFDGYSFSVHGGDLPHIQFYPEQKMGALGFYSCASNDSRTRREIFYRIPSEVARWKPEIPLTEEDLNILCPFPEGTTVVQVRRSSEDEWETQEVKPSSL